LFAVGIVTKVRKEPFDPAKPEFDTGWPVQWEDAATGIAHQHIAFKPNREEAEHLARDLNDTMQAHG
jgi:hypothetical protein